VDVGPEVGQIEHIEQLELTDLLGYKAAVGSFLDLDLAHSPVSLTVIDAAQIRTSGARHLGELLEIYVPGFQTMVNKWNGDIWGMRGIASDRNTKVVFLVDGLKTNHESRDGAYSELDLGLLGDLERVEVLRGPAGLMYGSGAIAGVVNLVTRRSERTAASGVVGWGTTEGARLEASSNLWLDADESLSIAAGYRRSDGLGERVSRIWGQNSWPADSEASPDGVPGDGSGWETPGNLRLSAGYRWRGLHAWVRLTHQVTPTGAYFEVDPWPGVIGMPAATEAPGTVDGELVGPTGPFALTESYGTNRRVHQVDQIIADLSSTTELGADQLQLEAAVIGVTNRIVMDAREGYGVPGAPLPAGTIEQTLGERRYLLGVEYRLGRVPHLQSALGVQYRLDDLGDDLHGLNLFGAVEAHPAITEVVYHNLAFYSETGYTLGALTAFAGARYDLHTRTGGVFSPKAALVWSASDNHGVKLIAQSAANNGSADNYEFNGRHYDHEGEVYDEPHLERPEDYTSPAIPATTVEDLHSLRPERAQSLELATFHRAGGLTLMPSVSVSRITDLFAWNQSLFRVVNAGRYDFVAAEAELRYEGGPVLLLGSHAWQRPLGTSGGETFQIPATEVIDRGDGTYGLQAVPGETQSVQVNPVADSVTADGRNFLNLATHASKLALDLEPLPWLTVHDSLRVWWGLPGRADIYEADEARGESYLGVHHRPIVKWNAGLLVDLPGGWSLDLHGYDLLATVHNRHAARWQQMAEPAQKEIYTVNPRAFSAQLGKAF
jgi:outer membrane receptor protein involved in Fe transport